MKDPNTSRLGKRVSCSELVLALHDNPDAPKPQVKPPPPRLYPPALGVCQTRLTVLVEKAQTTLKDHRKDLLSIFDCVQRHEYPQLYVSPLIFLQLPSLKTKSQDLHLRDLLRSGAAPKRGPAELRAEQPLWRHQIRCTHGGGEVSPAPQQDRTLRKEKEGCLGCFGEIWSETPEEKQLVFKDLVFLLDACQMDMKTMTCPWV